MSCHTKEELENMLYEIVDELHLSESMCEKHGQLGTSPVILVRLILEEKDNTIAMLKQNFKYCGNG